MVSKAAVRNFASEDVLDNRGHLRYLLGTLSKIRKQMFSLDPRRGRSGLAIASSPLPSENDHLVAETT